MADLYVTGLDCRFVPVSRVLPEERFLFRPLSNAPGFHRAVARYGCAPSHLTAQQATQRGGPTYTSPQTHFHLRIVDHQFDAKNPSCCMSAPEYSQQPEQASGVLL